MSELREKIEGLPVQVYQPCFAALTEYLSRSEVLAAIDEHEPKINALADQLRGANQDYMRAMNERDSARGEWSAWKLEAGKRTDERGALGAERDSLRVQLIDLRIELREEEKRHQRAAVDRDDARAELDNVRDCRIVPPCGRCVDCLDRWRLASKEVNDGLRAQLDQAQKRLAECEPVIEAVREHQEDPSDACKIVRRSSMKLPKKGPQS